MTVLDDIIAGVREDLAERQLTVPLERLQEQAERRESAKPALAALKDGDTVRVIAEVKRSSPSKGALAAIADPAALARDYEAGGAAVVSVLTERRRFGGSIADLEQVRRAIDLPVLRKDFVVTPYQVWEARAAGADMVLLIVAALEQEALVSLVERVHSLGMTALVEVHDADEMARAGALGADLVGVNNRDLRTFVTDLSITERLAAGTPKGALLVTESGIFTAAEVARLERSGARAMLVGESLMRQADVTAATKTLLGA